MEKRIKSSPALRYKYFGPVGSSSRLKFNKSTRDCLADLKKLAGEQSFHTWFSVHTHRHEETLSDNIPSPLLDVEDLFDIALQLQPAGTDIHIKPLKGLADMTSDLSHLTLDASSMLIK